MELFFEVCRQKTHIMADTREGGTAADIKQIIAGVMQRPVEEITLKRPKNEAQTEWETLQGPESLAELGFTQKTAKPDEPCLLAFLFPEDKNQVVIDELSTPPPLPEAMQNNDMIVD